MARISLTEGQWQEIQGSYMIGNTTYTRTLQVSSQNIYIRYQQSAPTDDPTTSGGYRLSPLQGFKGDGDPTFKFYVYATAPGCFVDTADSIPTTAPQQSRGLFKRTLEFLGF